MTRDESDRLRDIKDAIVTIREHLARAEEDPHAKDAALLHDALLFQFVVIGEAVKHLAQDNAKLGTRDPVGGHSQPARPDRARVLQNRHRPSPRDRGA